jgi:hypothetical protein
MAHLDRLEMTIKYSVGFWHLGWLGLQTTTLSYNSILFKGKISSAKTSQCYLLYTSSDLLEL